MRFLIRLAGLLGLATLLQLAGCAMSADVPTVLSQPVDSAVQHQAEAAQLYALPLLRSGRFKFKGPVTIQVGTGNVNAPQARAPVAAGAGQAQDYTGAGRHGGALATAPGASAGATTRTGVPPWLLGLVVGLVLLLALMGAAYRYRRRLAALLG